MLSSNIGAVSVLSEGIVDEGQRALIDDHHVPLKIDDPLAIDVVALMLLKNSD